MLKIEDRKWICLFADDVLHFVWRRMQRDGGNQIVTAVRWRALDFNSSAAFPVTNDALESIMQLITLLDILVTPSQNSSPKLGHAGLGSQLRE